MHLHINKTTAYRVDFDTLKQVVINVKNPLLKNRGFIKVKFLFQLSFLFLNFSFILLLLKYSNQKNLSAVARKLKFPSLEV